MKKNFLLLLFSITTFTQVKATDWFPVGAKSYWGSRVCCIPDDNPYFWNITKDTTIQSKLCKILVANDGNREVVFENNGVVEKYTNENFLPLYNFNKIKGDTILFVNDSGKYSCDTFYFVIDTVKLLAQNNMLKVQSGRFLKNSNCDNPFIRTMPYISIVERMGIPKFYNTIEYFSLEATYYYERCYEDANYNIHFVNYACDSIIDKINEKANINLPVKIFPNPVSDEIQVEFSENIKYQTLKLLLIDTNGEIIMSTQSDQLQKLKLNLSNCNNGLYYLKIIIDDEYIAKQIIISH